MTSEAEPIPPGAELTLSARQLRPPARVTVNKVVGLHLAWFVYRGGTATTEFDPPQVKVWEDTRTGANSPYAPLWQRPPVPEDGTWTTQVTFREPGEYVLELRVERARRLLARGESPAAAASEVGFHDQSHLTRAFRRFMSTTPGRYRQRARSVQDHLR